MRKNAKLYRNALRGLLAALAVGGFQVAHAAYTNATPPPNYKAAVGTAQATYAAAANDRTLQNFIRQVGGATVTAGGQAVKMTVGYKLGHAAGRVAAAVVYAHPGVRTAVGIAAWIAGAYIWDQATGKWTRLDTNQAPSTGYLYKSTSRPESDPWHSTPQFACQAELAARSPSFTSPNSISLMSFDETSCLFAMRHEVWGDNGFQSVTLQKKPSNCPAGSYETPAGCSPTPPPNTVTEEEFVNDLANKPMPSTVPKELPSPTHLPVESPSPILNPTEGDNPTPSPMRVPTGDPIPIPNTNPQQYRQPYVDIVPSPTVDNPWRVDVKPGETTSTNPNPVENPAPDGQDKPAEEQDKSLCEKHPDILACSKPELDVPDGEIPKATKQITYAEEGGFGGGSCPSNVYANLHGKQTMVYEWTRTCSVVSTYIRPIILLLGAMGALFILIPGRDS
jgi:hypothetical protein